MTDTATKPQIGIVRKVFGYALLGFGITCIMVLDQVDIVMNASHSLEEPAYLMVEHPVLLSHGTLVSATMPDALQASFGDYQFVKRIGGLPGDVITLNADGNPCINDQCYPPFLKNDAPISPLIAPGVIPDQHYALFGTSHDSLDSRYQVIGLISEDQLIGRGWPMPFIADWREAAQ
jgi:type IV secretory pathway protease TraF